MDWKSIGQNILNFLIELGTTVGLKILYAVIVVILGCKLVKLLVRRLRKGKLFQKMDHSVSNFLVNLINVSLRVIVFVTAAMILGVPATSFVAVLTSAGVAIGLALQGSLSNLAGGIMILIFKPFRIGDFIESSGNMKGTVEDISIFYTVLITPDNKVVHCPNGSLSNTDIVNYSKKEIRRVDLTVSCAYGSDVEQVKRLLTDTVVVHPLVLTDPSPFVRLNECADSSLNFTLRAWCKNADYWTVYFDLKEQVKKALDDNNIQIPFQQMDVHIKQDN
jgi:small conductance mechanosensitive channel